MYMFDFIKGFIASAILNANQPIKIIDEDRYVIFEGTASDLYYDRCSEDIIEYKYHRIENIEIINNSIILRL